jgi:hypothetical protein
MFVTAAILLGVAERGVASIPRPLFRGPACLQDVTVGMQGDSLAIGDMVVLDVTGDQVLDALVTVRFLGSAPGPSRTVLLKGEMHGGLPDLYSVGSVPAGFDVGLSTTLLTAGDLNGDGRVDFITADGVSPTVNVQVSNGSGSLNPVTVYTLTAPFPPNPNLVPRKLFIADMDHDGQLDVVANALEPGSGTSYLAVMRNLGGGSLQVSAFPISPGQTEFALGDLNGDLRPDILEFSKTGAAPSAIRLSTGPLVYGPAVPFGPAGPVLDALVIDANANGTPDVALLGASQLYLCYGTGGGAIGSGYDTIPLERATPLYLAAGDLDEDGSVDYVVSNSNNNTPGGTIEIVGLGNPSGTHTFLSPGKNPGRAVIADLDRDGVLDLLVPPWEDYLHRLAVLLGPLTGDKGIALPISSSAAPRSPAVADFNRDGVPDIAAAADGTIQLRYRDGAGAYTSGTPVATGLTPHRMPAWDLNRDAKPDILFGNLGGFPNFFPRLRVYTGNGEGVDDTLDLSPSGVIAMVGVHFAFRICLR